MKRLVGYKINTLNYSHIHVPTIVAQLGSCLLSHCFLSHGNVPHVKPQKLPYSDSKTGSAETLCLLSDESSAA